eukprot:14931843-Heterocapsa_arctica.AAC.1
MIFNDFHEVPIWLKIRIKKIVFADQETVPNSRKSKKMREGEVTIVKLSDTQESQRLPQAIQDL